MKIVFKCDNPECNAPDVVEYYPQDDNIPCVCGKGTQWGHWKNVEDIAKRDAYEAINQSEEE